MTCGETCSTNGCDQSAGCAAHQHAYRANFDTLGNRIQQQHASDTYASGLLGAFGFAGLIALPFVLFFWSL